MLIIINDDAAYVSWITRHRQGFVVDSLRKPKKNHLVLHRATCSVIKPHKRARLTTGAHIKLCCLDAAELAAWAEDETGGPLVPCGECQPDREEPVASDRQPAHALSRVGRDVLSYVLDLTVMYLDGAQGHYRPRIRDVAAYLDKTSRQIAPFVRRLVEEGYLECQPPLTHDRLPATAVLYPTARSLRTIPAFDAMAAGAIGAELARLRPPPDQTPPDQVPPG